MELQKDSMQFSLENTVYCIDAEIEKNHEISADIHHMVMDCPEMAAIARPGQFIHIRCSDGIFPLLRRPISIAMADKEKGTIEIIYRVVGEGTGFLARKACGEKLNIIGPLGKGFPIPEDIKFPAIIGGGIGMAPLLFLARIIKENRQMTEGLKRVIKPQTPDEAGGSAEPTLKDATEAAGQNISENNFKAKDEEGITGAVFAGFSSEKEMFGTSFLKDCGFKLEVCTDDGSLGYKGFPTDLLEISLKGRKPILPTSIGGDIIDVIYACGPKPLLAKVKSIALEGGLPAYLSLEEHMACGVGACLGCAVKSAGGGYLKVCKDGPVFEAREVEI